MIALFTDEYVLHLASMSWHMVITSTLHDDIVQFVIGKQDMTQPVVYKFIC